MLQNNNAQDVYHTKSLHDAASAAASFPATSMQQYVGAYFEARCGQRCVRVASAFFLTRARKRMSIRGRHTGSRTKKRHNPCCIRRRNKHACIATRVQRIHCCFRRNGCLCPHLYTLLRGGSPPVAEQALAQLLVSLQVWACVRWNAHFAAHAGSCRLWRRTLFHQLSRINAAIIQPGVCASGVCRRKALSTRSRCLPAWPACR